MNEEIKRLQEAAKAAEQTLYDNRNRLRVKEYSLAQVKRTGRSGADESARLDRDISDLQQTIERNKLALSGAKAQLGDLVGTFVLPKTPQQLVAELDDTIPFLLLPVRIETRFMRVDTGRELWVRVFPDDIAVHTHEKTLTREEADAGIAYWAAFHQAESLPEGDAKEGSKKAAWRLLAEPYGGPRAGWIVQEMKQSILGKQPDFNLSFLDIQSQFASALSDPAADAAQIKNGVLDILNGSNPVVPDIAANITGFLNAGDQVSDAARQGMLKEVRDGILRYLGFDLEVFKADTWSRAPRSEMMPDRFVLVGFTKVQNLDQKLERPFPAVVPNPLILGPNPQELEAELLQQDGNLLSGADFAWISQFDQAIAKGMAMRVTLPEPFATQGFDRLMVLGTRHSTDAADNTALLETMIDNHHYSPDSLSFIAQGTPTNNTGAQKSGYGKSDPGSEESFVVETGPANFTETGIDLEKCDAQRFAEALDISTTPLAFVKNAGQMDVSEAKWINKALWPATLGYFLAELLEFEGALTGNVRQFFAEHVQARGSLPAIRVGDQPYCILVTSAFDRWQVNSKVDGEAAPFLVELYDVLKNLQATWQELSQQVKHADAPGDPFQNLLDILGLQSGSATFAQRRAYHKNYLWNYAQFIQTRSFTVKNTTAAVASTDPAELYFRQLNTKAQQLLTDLGYHFTKTPALFDLIFSNKLTPITSPLVDDVEKAEDEKWSETEGLPDKYNVTISADDGEAVVEARNYIGWLVSSDMDVLKRQEFHSVPGATPPTPQALLYRMLHRALLLANYEASMNLYEANGLAASVRRESAFINIEAERTVTRWEFMEAPVNKVLPQVSQTALPLAQFLNTAEGLQLPAAFTLAEVKAAIGLLENLPTARLERLFTEHVDLCAYRLDAWQTGLFENRLSALRRLRQSPDGAANRRTGIHLGAYGWLENLRPAPEPGPVATAEIPESLREEGITVFSQPGNGGHIHGPSINHAVAAAVLRNAYLTHADAAHPEHFSVNLSSERVRTALIFLEGIRNGQELGALLGYQFERGLHDRYTMDGAEQFILNFRAKYPLVADKITPDGGNNPIETKEARQVFDGYALVEAAFLGEVKPGYPYGVEHLPLGDSDAGKAIIAEVERMAASLDAIADLALAEGVYQVVQGNYERAGAMLKTLSDGNAPPEPEITQTPRSGVAIHQKMTLHLEPGSPASPWGNTMTPRALAEPGLNNWLGTTLGPPEQIKFNLLYPADGDARTLTLQHLDLQPIDLIYLAGDKTGTVEGSQQINDLTELERRIDHYYRSIRRQEDAAWDDSGHTAIQFMDRTGFAAEDKTLFEMMPLLKNLRQLATGCRPLGANDYTLPSEETTNTAAESNPAGWNPDELRDRIKITRTALQAAFIDLQAVLQTIPPDAIKNDPQEVPYLNGVNFQALRTLLIRVSYFGLADAFPVNAVLPVLSATPGQEEALDLLRKQQQLIRQAYLIHDNVSGRLEQSGKLIELQHLTPAEKDKLTVAAKVDIFRSAGRLLLGDAFNLLPVFSFKNPAEVQTALAFSVAGQLTRHSGNPLVVEEFVQGVSVVRENVGRFERIRTFHEVFNGTELKLRPIQLPHADKAYWVAVEYPEVPVRDLDKKDVFVPSGDYLSLTMQLPSNYDPASIQSGLLIDEWSEVIPNRAETTGIAVHYNQPNTEPPQTLLLAVSPEINGHWAWDDLVDIVSDTFARARRRAVEPDQVLTTAYAQLLPAIITSVTGSNKVATISTPLATQAV